jgi:hypothetical protein
MLLSFDQRKALLSRIQVLDSRSNGLFKNYFQTRKEKALELKTAVDLEISAVWNIYTQNRKHGTEI